MLLQQEKSCLLVVDIQEKLTPHILQQQKLIKNCQWLMQLSRELKVPMLVSEQYPQGLGKTVKDLQAYFEADEVMSKVHFSCASDSKCLQRINDLERRHIIIVGIETHVCVLQTAIQLQLLGKQVYVVADAVSARDETDHLYGLQRMRTAGIQVITKEMIFFEWLQFAATPQFKTLSKKYLK
jgi:nicotinamidase-related amidase